MQEQNSSFINWNFSSNHLIIILFFFALWKWTLTVLVELALLEELVHYNLDYLHLKARAKSKHLDHPSHNTVNRNLIHLNKTSCISFL